MDLAKSVKEINEKVLSQADTRLACLCRIWTCDEDCGEFTCNLEHRWSQKYRCMHSDEDPVNKQASTCWKHKCRGARLVGSRWCATCFVKYKTAKGEIVEPWQLIPLTRKGFSTVAAESDYRRGKFESTMRSEALVPPDLVKLITEFAKF